MLGRIRNTEAKDIFETYNQCIQYIPEDYVELRAELKIFVNNVTENNRFNSAMFTIFGDIIHKHTLNFYESITGWKADLLEVFLERIDAVELLEVSKSERDMEDAYDRAVQAQYEKHLKDNKK